MGVNIKSKRMICGVLSYSAFRLLLTSWTRKYKHKVHSKPDTHLHTKMYHCSDGLALKSYASGCSLGTVLDDTFLLSLAHEIPKPQKQNETVLEYSQWSQGRVIVVLNF